MVGNLDRSLWSAIPLSGPNRVPAPWVYSRALQPRRLSHPKVWLRWPQFFPGGSCGTPETPTGRIRLGSTPLSFNWSFFHPTDLKQAGNDWYHLADGFQPSIFNKPLSCISGLFLYSLPPSPNQSHRMLCLSAWPFVHQNGQQSDISKTPGNSHLRPSVVRASRTNRCSDSSDRSR